MTVGERAQTSVPVCSASTSISEVAARMTAARSRCAVITNGTDAVWGIVTDGDLRRRVVAGGVGRDSEVAGVATTPVHTVPSTRSVADAGTDMMAIGVRHLVVVDAAGALVGVVDDADLFSSATLAGVLVRTAIARAETAEDLITRCADIPSVVIAAHDSRVAPADVAGIRSVLVRAAFGRAVALVGPELTAREIVVLGSVARREALPSSDLETAAVVASEDRVGAATRSGAAVHDLLRRCGIRPDPHNALASQRRFVRTREGWTAAVDGWIADPLSDRGIVMLSLLADASAVGGVAEFDLAEHVRSRLADSSRAQHLLLREATVGQAKLVLRDKLFRRTESADLKESVLSSITDIARWAGLRSGSPERTTLGRLADAGAAGVLGVDDAQVLAESFDVVQRIRLGHQCDQVRAGVTPDDVVSLADLTPLARSLLSNAAREVAGMQRALAYSVT